MDTGLRDECVDAVLLHDVIHLIDERAALFGEMYRVLKPDGLVSMYPMHVDNDEVSRQMRESGFSLEAEEYDGVSSQ
jgi:ubiquinone/menaquinone biosynthesis C-methylase UbiE